MSLYKKICLESSSGNIIVDKIGKHASLTVNTIQCEQFLDQYTKELKDRIKELEKLLRCTEECMDYKQQEQISEIERLTEQLAEREGRLKDFVKLYQDKDLSCLPESYQRAFDLFIKGEYKAALALLDEEILIETEKAQAENRILKGRILLSMDCLKEAEANFRKAAEIFSSVENYLAWGNFYGNTRQYNKAIICFKKALKLNDDKLIKMTSFRCIGRFYSNLEDKIRADRYFQKASKLMFKLSIERGCIPYSEALEMLCDIAWFAYENQDYAMAEEKYKNALEIQRKALACNQKKFPYDRLADTLHCLARVLVAKKEEESAEILFLEAIETWEEHLCEEPEIYYPKLAETLKYYADLMSKRDVSIAEKCYLRALDIFRNHVSKFQLVFEPILSQILLSMCMFYFSIGKEKQTLVYLKECAEIMERLAVGRTDVYFGKLGYVYFQLGVNVQETELSKMYFIKCIYTFDRMNCRNSFLGFKAMANYNLAVIHGIDHVLEYARYMEEAIRIQRLVVKEKSDPQEWKTLLEWSCYMENYYSCLNNVGKAFDYRNEVDHINKILDTILE